MLGAGEENIDYNFVGVWGDKLRYVSPVVFKYAKLLGRLSAKGGLEAFICGAFGSVEAPAEFEECLGKKLFVLRLRVCAALQSAHLVLFHRQITSHGLKQLLRIHSGDNDQSIGIAHQQVSRHYHLAAADHRHVHLSRPFTVRAKRSR